MKYFQERFLKIYFLGQCSRYYIIITIFYILVSLNTLYHMICFDYCEMMIYWMNILNCYPFTLIYIKYTYCNYTKESVHEMKRAALCWVNIKINWYGLAFPTEWLKSKTLKMMLKFLRALRDSRICSTISMKKYFYLSFMLYRRLN